MPIHFGAITRVLPDDRLLKRNNISPERARELTRQMAKEAYQSQGAYPSTPVAAFHFDTGKVIAYGQYMPCYSGYVIATKEDAVLLNGMEKTRQSVDSLEGELITHRMGLHILKKLGITPNAETHYFLSRDTVTKIDTLKAPML